MESNLLPLLSGFVRLANQAREDRPRALQKILYLLRQALSLDTCRILILSPSGKSFTRQLAATGPARFTGLSLRAAGSHAGSTLHSGRPFSRGRRWYLPIQSPHRSWGVLHLELGPRSPAAAELAPLLEAVAGLIALAFSDSEAEAVGATGTTLAQWQALSAENDRKYREISLLYRLSRAMHGTLKLNELIHLILSAATLPEGGGFERALLFMVNERSGILQGMLGVTRETAALVLPVRQGLWSWERPAIDQASREAQRRTDFSRRVMDLRFSLNDPDNPLSRSVRERQVVPLDANQPGSEHFSSLLDLDFCACAPLLGRERPLAVLVVANPPADGPLTPGRLRFLQLFASQAESAMENSMLVHRLETAHQDLRETQERLIQGEKMAVLGEMAASVAHELKNPLVAIGGFAQRLARRAQQGGRDQEEMLIIAREVRRMEKMLENILAFSKKNMLCFGPCDLVEILDEALAMEKDAMAREGIRLQLEKAESLPPVLGDCQKLRQVILNLLANARQAMAKQGGTLSVRAYPDKLRGDEALALEVEDSGGGIPSEVLRNIFNPFFSTKEEGTGLGLSISHRIVELHNGEIEVQNREGGAAFILRIPAAKLSVDKPGSFG